MDGRNIYTLSLIFLPHNFLPETSLRLFPRHSQRKCSHMKIRFATAVMMSCLIAVTAAADDIRRPNILFILL